MVKENLGHCSLPLLFLVLVIFPGFPNMDSVSSLLSRLNVPSSFSLPPNPWINFIAASDPPLTCQDPSGNTVVFAGPQVWSVWWDEGFPAFDKHSSSPQAAQNWLLTQLARPRAVVSRGLPMPLATVSFGRVWRGSVLLCFWSSSSVMSRSGIERVAAQQLREAAGKGTGGSSINVLKVPSSVACSQSLVWFLALETGRGERRGWNSEQKGQDPGLGGEGGPASWRWSRLLLEEQFHSLGCPLNPRSPCSSKGASLDTHGQRSMAGSQLVWTLQPAPRGTPLEKSGSCIW